MKRHLCILLSAITCVFLAACLTVGPDYVPPTAGVPDAWHAAAVGGLDVGEADLQTWWTTFQDPLLTDLIERAGSSNLSARIALARIEEARAQLASTRGERLPDVDGIGTAQRIRSSEAITPSIPPGLSRTDTFYQAGFDAVWELDTWGRIRRSIESADASYAATIEDYRDVMVSLYAEVASTYIAARNFQERIAVAVSNVETQRSSVELTRNRFDAGLVGMLDVRQAELNLATTEAAIPQLRSAYLQAVNRLGVLLGEYPSALHAEMNNFIDTPIAAVRISEGLPADLLRQRPDVRAAERRLAAQSARIGAQQALLYPTFVLGGTFTLEAFDGSDLIESGSRAYGFGPAFRWNLFDGSRIRNSVRVQELRTQQALLTYEQTVLSAVEDVESAMVAIVQEHERLQALERAAIAADRSVDLVDTLYRTGLTDFQNVLDMQRAKFVQNDAYAVSKGDVAQNMVRLYKALGGGWRMPASDTEQEV